MGDTVVSLSDTPAKLHEIPSEIHGFIKHPKNPHEMALSECAIFSDQLTEEVKTSALCARFAVVLRGTAGDDLLPLWACFETF